ncbi:PREDICTED: LOW QUALITY PROTEIN [Prunus dulcis]|uniref:PREDICTED: LOW QUALITY PROTEIN n=1 Tax=Prunus dulcis TaxID=3755 RepID=A0A5E4ETD5_PRUDU|nr:PREDICTED: LOW QUALITY PROTEIN [Prunus dulcis]
MAAPTTLVGSPELKQPVTSSPPPPQLQLLYQLASVPSTTKDNYRSFEPPQDPSVQRGAYCWALGDFKDILEVLYGILDVNAVRKRRSRSRNLWFDYEEDVIQKKVGSGADTSSNTRKKMIDMARKAVEMYERDPDYQLLHERVSDLYAECLKSDIQNLKKYEKQKMENVNGPDKLNLELKLTMAAKWCPSVDSFFDRSTLLCETIARKLFPREECKKGNSVEEEEADYVSRVRERLMNEVLEPLRKVIKEGYEEKYVPYERRGEDPRVKKYLIRVNSKKIEAGAMLPHQIIGYVNDRPISGNWLRLSGRRWWRRCIQSRESSRTA